MKKIGFSNLWRFIVTEPTKKPKMHKILAQGKCTSCDNTEMLTFHVRRWNGDFLIIACSKCRKVQGGLGIHSLQLGCDPGLQKSIMELSEES